MQFKMLPFVLIVALVAAGCFWVVWHEASKDPSFVPNSGLIKARKPAPPSQGGSAN
jgi:hypothetical protein